MSMKSLALVFAVIFFMALSGNVAADRAPIAGPCVYFMLFVESAIQARLMGESEKNLLSDLDVEATHSKFPKGTPRYNAMVNVIKQTYKTNLKSDRAVKRLVKRAYDSCVKVLPLSREQRAGKDTDGDGFPDYDEAGNPIPKIIV